MIPGDLLSACPHRQFHTLPGLLDSWAALPNSYPNACMPMQGGSLYHFYDGLWYDPAERRTHDLPCERRTRYRLSQPDTVIQFGRRFWYTCKQHILIIMIKCLISLYPSYPRPNLLRSATYMASSARTSLLQNTVNFLHIVLSLKHQFIYQLIKRTYLYVLCIYRCGSRVCPSVFMEDLLWERPSVSQREGR